MTNNLRAFSKSDSQIIDTEFINEEISKKESVTKKQFFKFNKKLFKTNFKRLTFEIFQKEISDSVKDFYLPKEQNFT